MGWNGELSRISDEHIFHPFFITFYRIKKNKLIVVVTFVKHTNLINILFQMSNFKYISEGRKYFLRDQI